MKNKRLKLNAILLVGLGLTSLQAQNMYVKEKSGIQTAYTLSSVRKMSFLEASATIQKTDNTTAVYALSGLRYLNFTDLSTSITEQPVQLGSGVLIAYPNPVTNVLNIDLTSIATQGTISILTLEGKVLQTQKTNGTKMVTINVSQLPKGIYLFRFANPKEIKIVKIFKQ